MLTYGIIQLSKNVTKIETLVQGISAKQAQWRPDETSWSVLEVVNHLYDVEQEDFAPRLKHILEQAPEPWSSIEPTKWPQTRDYNSRELSRSIVNFVNARQSSIAWLNTVTKPDWQLSHTASWGTITAGDMFAAWVAHDLLHMRQIVELLWAYNSREVVPYAIRYAGEW